MGAGPDRLGKRPGKRWQNVEKKKRGGHFLPGAVCHWWRAGLQKTCNMGGGPNFQTKERRRSPHTAGKKESLPKKALTRGTKLELLKVCEFHRNFKFSNGVGLHPPQGNQLEGNSHGCVSDWKKGTARTPFSAWKVNGRETRGPIANGETIAGQTEEHLKPSSREEKRTPSRPRPGKYAKRNRRMVSSDVWPDSKGFRVKGAMPPKKKKTRPTLRNRVQRGDRYVAFRKIKVARSKRKVCQGKEGNSSGGRGLSRKKRGFRKEHFLYNIKKKKRMDQVGDRHGPSLRPN